MPDVPKAFAASNELEVNATHKDRQPVDYVMNGHQYQLPDGAVVIAAITSCTNTSNPKCADGRRLAGEKAVTLGLKRQPWVKSVAGTGFESRF
ncbi:aconitase family protein [Escherichia coli]